MADALNSSVETEAVGQSAWHLSEATITVETSDGVEHDVYFALAEEEYFELEASDADPLFLSNLITEYNAFTREAAAACGEALDAAVTELDRRIEELNENHRQTFEYTLDAPQYELHAATYSPGGQSAVAEMPRPEPPENYTFLRESVKGSGNQREFRLELDTGTQYSVTVDDEEGYVIDATSPEGELTSENITDLFDAVRAVQVALINRGWNLDPSMCIELYQGASQ